MVRRAASVVLGVLAVAACGARTGLDEGSDAGVEADGPCTGPPLELVSAARGADAIALESTSRWRRLFWAQWYFGGSVSAVRAPGPESRVIADGQPAVRAIAADARGVYWVAVGWSERGGTLAQGAISSGVEAPRILAGDLFQPGDLAIDDASVFFLEGSNSGSLRDEGRGVVERIGRDGSGRRRLASGLGLPTAIAIDATHVYWVDTWRGMVARVPSSGGAIEELATGLEGPRELALDRGELFFVEGGALRALSTAGGAARVVAEPAGAGDLAADATHVYWTSGEGIHRARREGGAAELVHATPGARQLALDPTRIFWTGEEAGEGHVRMMCKPAS